MKNLFLFAVECKCKRSARDHQSVIHMLLMLSHYSNVTLLTIYYCLCKHYNFVNIVHVVC